MLVVLWDILRTMPELVKLIKEIREDIELTRNNAKVKDKVNELRKLHKAENLSIDERRKALNDNLNSR